MTLVATMLSEQSTPFMISDTLLSSNLIDSKLNPITYPTSPRGKNPVSVGFVGLCQKVVEIRPNLFIGWSGSYIAAGRFISNIRLMSRIKQTTHEMLSKECKDYFELLHPEDVNQLSANVLTYEDGAYYQITCNSAKSVIHDNLGRVTVIGSGSSSFLDYINKVPLGPLQETYDFTPMNVNRIHYFLSYIIDTQNYQKETGFGIGEGWGGGFEIVLSKSGGNIEKLDRVIYLTFVWWFDKTTLRTFWTGSRYFYYSLGHQLSILSQERYQRLRRHIAVPPDYEMIPGEQALEIQQRSPQFACVKLINRDSSKSRVVLEYSEKGLSWCGVAPFLQFGDSIRADSDYVEKLIRSYASDDAI